MEIYLDRLIDWLITLSPLSVYSIFFLIAYLENVIPPIPGDLLVAFGGYLAAEQVVGFFTLLVLTTTASVIGFMSMYGIGSYWGYRIEERKRRMWLVRWVDFRYVKRGKRWMQRWGQWVIAANRFLAGMRSVIALTAGIYQTRVRMTIVSSTISSVSWNFILLSLGWMIHDNWIEIGEYLNLYGWMILILILLFVLSRWLWKRGDRSG